MTSSPRRLELLQRRGELVIAREGLGGLVLARNDELTASLEKLKSARLTIDSLTSEVDSLQVKLTTAKDQTVQVTLQLDDTRKALARAEQLALVRKKEYDALKETHVLAVAVLDKLRGQAKELEGQKTELEKKNAQ